MENYIKHVNFDKYRIDVWYIRKIYSNILSRVKSDKTLWYLTKFDS